MYALFQWCRPPFLAESLNLTGTHRIISCPHQHFNNNKSTSTRQHTCTLNRTIHVHLAMSFLVRDGDSTASYCDDNLIRFQWNNRAFFFFSLMFRNLLKFGAGSLKFDTGSSEIHTDSSEFGTGSVIFDINWVKFDTISTNQTMFLSHNYLTLIKSIWYSFIRIWYRFINVWNNSSIFDIIHYYLIDE